MQQYSTFNAVDMPDWTHCFVSIIRTDFDAARLLLLTLNYDQFHKLAVIMAEQAGCETQRTLKILVDIKEGD